MAGSAVLFDTKFNKKSVWKGGILMSYGAIAGVILACILCIFLIPFVQAGVMIQMFGEWVCNNLSVFTQRFFLIICIFGMLSPFIHYFIHKKIFEEDEKICFFSIVPSIVSACLTFVWVYIINILYTCPNICMNGGAGSVFDWVLLTGTCLVVTGFVEFFKFAGNGTMGGAIFRLVISIIFAIIMFFALRAMFRYFDLLTLNEFREVYHLDVNSKFQQLYNIFYG